MLEEGLYGCARATVEEEDPDHHLVVALDPVNSEKPYTHESEGVSTVHKSPPPDRHGKARLARGYPAITATVVNTRVPSTTYANWFSYTTTDFVSENREIHRAIETTGRLFPKRRVRFVGDSGPEDQKIFERMGQEEQAEFVIRASRLERLVEGLNRARELAGDGAAEPMVENSVGAGTQLCSTFDALAGAAEKAGVRVCVDTAHAYVAGYDLSTPEGAREVTAELKTVLDGRIALLHLNDPRNGLGSRRDGHERIGEGRVPVRAWEVFLGALPNVPVVMETPYATPETDAEQVRLVKELAGGLLLSPRGV